MLFKTDNFKHFDEENNKKKVETVFHPKEEDEFEAVSFIEDLGEKKPED